MENLKSVITLILDLEGRLTLSVFIRVTHKKSLIVYNIDVCVLEYILYALIYHFLPR